jgi:peptidoglycan/LPS O-acetylase OafA/YrhL
MSTERMHLPVLDGVRGLSIVLVLAAHLLPLRLGSLGLNDSVGILGMALFFVLSGFLITEQLLLRPSWQSFAWRRLLRVLPAAWLCAMVVWAFVAPVSVPVALSHLFFYANLPPQQLTPPLSHYWSLCVEVQFYLAAALLLCVHPKWTRRWLPLALLAATAWRVTELQMASSYTWFRIDDLLAGACLALLRHSTHWPRVQQLLGQRAVPTALLLGLAVACVLPTGTLNPLSFLRPYLVATMLAALLVSQGGWLATQLSRSPWGYVASVSYALYLWHMPLAATWLGSGELLEKYLKRPLLFAVLLAVAHLTTYHFERPLLAWGRRWHGGRGVRA